LRVVDQKAAYRPFVPENLRALNLAALEMVDYVTISRDAKPLDSLARLCPDYYAKGYEYSDGGIHPKTREEMDVLAGYGGEMLFTPGDIVFSSSHIIENVPPNIAIDKLLTLMQAEGVDFSDLRRSVEEMRGVSVHVLGDTIIDSLTYTTMIGGMTKTPTPSVRHDRREDFIGGAAIVAQHLRAAGAEVTFSTVLGDDAFKDPVLSSLAADGIVIKAVIDASRPTTHKNAFVCGGYRLLKVDTLDNRSISDAILDRLMGQLAETSAQAVVFSDFRHGIFNRRTIPGLIKAIPDGAFRVGDSQVASRWGNVLDFKGFDMLTPNEREARFALADQDTGIRPLSVRLRREAECGTVILKLGDRGILTCRDADPTAFRSFFTVDSFADHVADAVGAGDALLAYATLAMV
ncbi:MAG: ADP-heptose synthase, partial [Rhodospirillales bacterium]|nr:ADP-heptose synthase [Rhodospirillales bacterium]